MSHATPNRVSVAAARRQTPERRPGEGGDGDTVHIGPDAYAQRAEIGGRQNCAYQDEAIFVIAGDDDTARRGATRATRRSLDPLLEIKLRAVFVALEALFRNRGEFSGGALGALNIARKELDAPRDEAPFCLCPPFNFAVAATGTHADLLALVERWGKQSAGQSAARRDHSTVRWSPRAVKQSS